jgi:hypothetical protein
VRPLSVSAAWLGMAAVDVDRLSRCAGLDVLAVVQRCALRARVCCWASGAALR